MPKKLFKDMTPKERRSALGGSAKALKVRKQKHEELRRNNEIPTIN